MMLNTKEQKYYISQMDSEAKQILQPNGQDKLWLLLRDRWNILEEIIDSTSPDEFVSYCKNYPGFFQYIKLLNKIFHDWKQGRYDYILNSDTERAHAG